MLHQMTCGWPQSFPQIERNSVQIWGLFSAQMPEGVLAILIFDQEIALFEQLMWDMV